MDTKILEQLEECFAEEIALAGNDLNKLEALVQEKLPLLGQGLLQRLVNRGANGYHGSSMGCNCGRSMKFVQHRSKDVQTLFGWITVKRAYYHCRACGSSLSPYDKASGLGGSHLSAALARVCCLLAVDDSFEQSSRKLEALIGQKVSDNTIERVVHQVGSVAKEQQNRQLQRFFELKQIPELQSEAEKLYVAVDGTTVHETDGWHETKVAVVYFEDKQGRRKRWYVGRFDNSETFGWHVWLEACRRGFREAKVIVYLGDGAPWIRTEYRRHFGKAIFIIDWYHASEHVWDCGKQLFGEGTKLTEDWVKKRLDWLWDGWTKRLLDDLNEHRKRYRSAKREAIDTLIRYISTNEEQMLYDVFRAKGYDIGSGAVEGACKYVVGKRLKQSGMVWTRSGSSSVLALRVSWLNEQWEQLWRKKPLVA